MYLSFIESFALWLEMQGSSRKNALYRAAVAFSLYALIVFVSIVAFLSVVAGIPVARWISAHTWSIWVVAALIALAHWRIIKKLSKRTQGSENSLNLQKPSPHLWCFYFIPILVLLVAIVVIAITHSIY